MAVLIYIYLFFVKFKVDRLFVWGIPAFVVFILISMAFRSWKTPKPLMVLGNVSYSLYLTHTFVITFFSKKIYDIDHEISVLSIIAAIGAVALAIGVAYLSWYLIEVRLTNWVQGKLTSLKSR